MMQKAQTLWRLLHLGRPLRPGRRTSARRFKRGFSLIEVLVVLAIIGLIMGLIGPRALSAFGEAKAKTARLQIENLTSSLDLFYLDAGRYPTSEEGLSALVRKPADVLSWTGPYLKGGNVPKDPWGRAYAYRIPAGEATSALPVLARRADEAQRV